MRPYNALVHPRSWRAFMEYGNGIMGDMCVHMLDMVRWMLDLGMPARISSAGGILIDKASKANITDSQTATFDFGNLQVVWTHRSYGAAPDPKYPWAATFYGDKGTLKAGVMGYDFTPSTKNDQPMHEDVTYELDQFPEDRTEKDLETHVAPARARSYEGFSDLHPVPSEAGVGHRTGIHVGHCLHPREPVHEARAKSFSGITRKGRSWGMPRRTSCYGVPIAARGFIRNPARFKGSNADGREPVTARGV